MKYRDLFFSYQGRISRKPFWIGNLIMFAVLMVLVTPLTLLIAFGGVNWGRRGAASISLVAFLILLYPWTAILVKRMHDRDRPGILALLYVVPALLSEVSNVLGLTGDPERWTTLDYLLSAIMIAVVLWILVEFGFMRGTPGPNRYGPDPLSQ